MHLRQTWCPLLVGSPQSTQTESGVSCFCFCTGKKSVKALDCDSFAVGPQFDRLQVAPLAKGVDVSGVTIEKLGGGFSTDHLQADCLGTKLIVELFITVSGCYCVRHAVTITQEPRGWNRCCFSLFPPFDQVAHPAQRQRMAQKNPPKWRAGQTVWIIYKSFGGGFKFSSSRACCTTYLTKSEVFMFNLAASIFTLCKTFLST